MIGLLDGLVQEGELEVEAVQLCAERGGALQVLEEFCGGATVQRRGVRVSPAHCVPALVLHSRVVLAAVCVAAAGGARTASGAGRHSSGRWAVEAAVSSARSTTTITTTTTSVAGTTTVTLQQHTEIDWATDAGRGLLGIVAVGGRTQGQRQALVHGQADVCLVDGQFVEQHLEEWLLGFVLTQQVLHLFETTLRVVDLRSDATVDIEASTLSLELVIVDLFLLCQDPHQAEILPAFDELVYFRWWSIVQ
mmetsp:Transcript_6362/g.19256  ORF Transcript_6362/g.19256 Transcript_6362/m.19256 type:complete len:250 (-) Transcript_6362:973-1722(-)